MLVQLKTEVKGIAIELSVTEAQVFLLSPDKVQDDVRRMLQGSGVKCPDEKSVKKKSVLVACPNCGKRVKERGLKIHQARGCSGPGTGGMGPGIVVK